MIVADLDRPSTVLALGAGVVGSVGSVLLALAELLQRWTEPACDPGAGEHVAACAITGDDYLRALPYVVIALGFALFTTLGCRRVLLHAGQSGRSSSAIRTTVAIVIAVPVLAVLGLVLVALAVNL